MLHNHQSPVYEVPWTRPAGAPQGARVGMRHGTNTEALGDDGAAGAAAMNAMEATDTADRQS